MFNCLIKVIGLQNQLPISLGEDIGVLKYQRLEIRVYDGMI